MPAVQLRLDNSPTKRSSCATCSWSITYTPTCSTDQGAWISASALVLQSDNVPNNPATYQRYPPVMDSATGTVVIITFEGLNTG